MRQSVLTSFYKTAERLRVIQGEVDLFEFLLRIRFQKLGFDPIEQTELNFVEQLNQTFSDLVVLEGARQLLSLYPDKEFVIRFGAESGFDIESVDGLVVGECFAVTTVKSNDKFNRDVKKLIERAESCHKYIFFYSQCDADSYLQKRFHKYPQVRFCRIESLLTQRDYSANTEN